MRNDSPMRGFANEQAIAELKEATRLYLEEFPLPQTSPRFATNIEVIYAYNTKNLTFQL
jgi:hypothetical protein